MAVPNIENRVGWVFEDTQNEQQIDDRIQECLVHIIGYDPFSLLDKRILVTMPIVFTSNDVNGYILNLDDYPKVGVKVQNIVSQTPDDQTLWLLEFPPVYLRGDVTNKDGEVIARGVKVTFTRLQSCYVSWEDFSVPKGLLWDIFVETDYEDLEFVAENVSLKVF